ncbi:MAG: hypothetical protein R6U21_07215 [Thermoplasmatota archaeon]
MNIILLIVGLIILLIGIGSFINPNIARWINLPGTKQIKAIAATIIGIIMIILSFTI